MPSEHNSMKATYEVRPEGTAAIFNELALNHKQSASYYREMGEKLKAKSDNDGAADFFIQLATYREKLATEINNHLSGMAGTVHTPSHDSLSYFKEHEADLNRALINGNVVELAMYTYHNEEKTSDTYRHALADDKIDDTAEQMLHDQHEQVLKYLRMADRYKTVPQDANEEMRRDNPLNE